MYIFEILDIMFLIKSSKFPSNGFNINHFISFSSSGTRTCGVKLIHNISSTNKQRNFYFVRICRLWNALPIIDLTLPIHIIKKHLKMLYWNHFNGNFDIKYSYISFPLSMCQLSELTSTCQLYSFSQQ